MDELEINIRTAWQHVREKLIRFPRLLRERRERVERHASAPPLRSWCVAVRASDTRLNETRACLLSSKDADQGESHTVLLPSKLVATLARPVRIMYPGASSATPGSTCVRSCSSAAAPARRVPSRRRCV